MPPAVQALVPPCSNFNSFGVRMGRRRKFLSKLFSFFPRFEKLEIIYKYIVGYIIMANGRFVNSFLKILSLFFHRSFTDETQESLLTIFLFSSIKRIKRTPVSEVLFVVLCDPKRRVQPGKPSFSVPAQGPKGNTSPAELAGIRICPQVLSALMPDGPCGPLSGRSPPSGGKALSRPDPGSGSRPRGARRCPR